MNALRTPPTPGPPTEATRPGRAPDASAAPGAERDPAAPNGGGDTGETAATAATAAPGRSARPRRRRDAAASRRSILDAAEELFAQRGYDGASMGEIGRRAGVSSALPAYFFGGKDGLYAAVLERLMAAREERLEPVAARAADELERSGRLRPALELLIDGYIDFLRARPALVALMAREALGGARRLGPGPRHSVAVQAGLARFVRSLPPPPGPSVDPEQLLITTVALCFFPFEHNDTMLAAIGLDARDESFAATRKRHVVDVLERVLTSGP